MHRLIVERETTPLRKIRFTNICAIDVTRKTPTMTSAPKLASDLSKISFITSKTKLQKLVGCSLEPSMRSTENRHGNLFNSVGLRVAALKEAKPEKTTNFRDLPLIKRSISRHKVLCAPTTKHPERRETNLREFRDEQSRYMISRRPTELKLGGISIVEPDNNQANADFLPFKRNSPLKPPVRTSSRRVFDHRPTMPLSYLSVSQPKLAFENTNSSQGESKPSPSRPDILTPSESAVPKAERAVKYFVQARNRVDKLWSSILQMRKMKLTPQEIATGKVLCRTHYEHEFSREFFVAIKMGDIRMVQEYLDLNRYLVYDFDSVYLAVVFEHPLIITNRSIKPHYIGLLEEVT